MGNIDNLAQQYEDSDLLLVPTPITLGIRVRILTAMMYGKLIVAHTSNKQGIPELINQQNCLLGRSGKELSEQIIKVYKSRNGFNKISKMQIKHLKNISQLKISLKDIQIFLIDNEAGFEIYFILRSFLIF